MFLRFVFGDRTNSNQDNSSYLCHVLLDTSISLLGNLACDTCALCGEGTMVSALWLWSFFTVHWPEEFCVCRDLYSYLSIKPEVWPVIRGENDCPDLFTVDDSKGKATQPWKGVSLQSLVHSLSPHLSWNAAPPSTDTALPGLVGF